MSSVGIEMIMSKRHFELDRFRTVMDTQKKGLIRFFIHQSCQEPDKSEEAPNPPKKTRGPKDSKEPPQEKDSKGDGSKKNKGPETDEPEKPKRRRKQ